MRYFPVFFDLQERRVVVVGGGEEALRKVRLLLKTRAQISVVAADLHPELLNDRVQWLATSYQPDLLDGAALVYSADPALNMQVSRDAKARGIPVNAVDNAEISTFIIPSIVDRDPVVVAIGTEGTAPVLGQSIRAAVDRILPLSTGHLAATAASLRERVAKQVPHGNRRRAFWHRFFFGEPGAVLESGDHVAFELAVGDAMYSETQPIVGKLSSVTLTSEDPDDLTIGAHRLLQQADVIVHDRQVPKAILETARRDAIRACADEADHQAYVKKGLHVVRLSSVRSSNVVPLPLREDIRDAALRIVS